jgi:hypothetical protein
MHLNSVYNCVLYRHVYGPRLRFRYGMRTYHRLDSLSYMQVIIHEDMDPEIRVTSSLLNGYFLRCV